MMKKTSLIGTYMLTLFILTSTIISSEAAPIGFNLVGRGTATYEGKSYKISIRLSLNIETVNELMVAGGGRGQLVIQRTGSPIIVSFIGGDDSPFGGVIWRINRDTKELEIIDSIETYDLYLSGTAETIGNQRNPRIPVQLSGEICFPTLSGAIICVGINLDSFLTRDDLTVLPLEQ
jgi:hypothetical protein